MYGKQHVFWLIYGTEVDLPAILAKLVGLGYEVAKSGYREGVVYFDPLPGGYAAVRRYEEGDVYLLANLQRGAIGVVAEDFLLLKRGLADLSRALIELKIGEPPRAELHISFGIHGRLREGGEVKVGDTEFRKSGVYLTAGTPFNGDGVFVSISPLGVERLLFYLIVSGSWAFVISRLNTIYDIISQLLRELAT